MKTIKFYQLKHAVISLACNRLQNGLDYNSIILACFGSIAAKTPLDLTLKQWEDKVVSIIDATDIRCWKSLIRNFVTKDNYSGMIPAWIFLNLDKCQVGEDDKDNWIIYLPEKEIE